MDACTTPGIHEVDVIKGAQIGWTTILKLLVAYFVHQDPSPMLLVQPTLEMASAFSKDRLAPMIRDMKILTELIGDTKSRTSGNTILHKQFPGGHLTMAGANSPASLASRPCRLGICDEPDRYPKSAGTEGDPTMLVLKRLARFWNWLLVFGGTPTIKGQSVTEARFLESDMRRFFVPCPFCSELQVLKFGGRDHAYGIKWPKGNPDAARYVCKACGKGWTDAQRWRACEKGIWTPTNPDGKPGRAGFHIWEAYYPGTRLSEMVRAFLEAKKLPETLQAWVNTTLGETWDLSKGAAVASDPLLARRKPYPPDPIPAGACLLTAAVDVQGDRLELEVAAWGPGEERWSLEHRPIIGDPTGPDVWKVLDTHLRKVYKHPSGTPLRIARTVIDSGAFTEHVYRYCARRFPAVIPIKGMRGEGRPLIAASTKRMGVQKIRLFMVGTTTAKDIVSQRLQIREPGPGFCHFPTRYEGPYFRQLCAEERTEKGWDKRHEGARNEAWDLAVYNQAALGSINTNLETLHAAVVSGAAAAGGGGRRKRKGFRKLSGRS